MQVYTLDVYLKQYHKQILFMYKKQNLSYACIYIRCISKTKVISKGILCITSKTYMLNLNIYNIIPKYL